MTKLLTLPTVSLGISSAIELLQESMKHLEKEYSKNILLFLETEKRKSKSETWLIYEEVKN